VEGRNLGTISWLITRAKKDKVFQSESLDNLAEVMQVTKILKKSKSDRYYKTHTVQGGLAFLDRVFFDTKYFEPLLPDEILAVGAHEFTHINSEHAKKKVCRLLLPAIIIGSIIALIVFSNFALFSSPFNMFGKNISSAMAGVFSCFIALICSFYLNAKWLRQQETDCDLSSVKFLNNGPMASALIKLSNLYPKKTTPLDRFFPKLYPSLEQRIRDIQTAAENKRKQQ
jgi:Zn-dependent protease with chaperone function